MRMESFGLVRILPSALSGLETNPDDHDMHTIHKTEFEMTQLSSYQIKLKLYDILHYHCVYSSVYRSRTFVRTCFVFVSITESDGISLWNYKFSVMS